MFGLVRGPPSFERRRNRGCADGWLKGMRADLHSHGDTSLRRTEQERFHELLRRYEFDADREACSKLGQDCAGTISVGGSPIGVRLLSYVKWPRRSTKGDGHCLYHPWVHEDRATRYRADGCGSAPPGSRANASTILRAVG